MAKNAFAHIEDKELLNKFYSDGNNVWLGILLERYTLLLFGVCMKYLKNEEEARDAVQQVFLKVLMELPKYKVDFFKSWLHTITKNFCLMKLREKTNYPSVEISEKVLSKETPDSLKELLEKDFNLNLMEEGLNLLNDEQKRCVSLFYLQKKSYQKISDLTGFSILQVKSHIQNGKRNLKLIVEKKMKKVNG